MGLSNEQIARIAHAAEGGDWSEAGDRSRGQMIDLVHELRTRERESDGDTFDIVARACLTVAGEDDAAVQEVLDHQRLELRGQALGSAINFLRGSQAAGEPGPEASDAVSAARVFEDYLMGAPGDGD